MKLFVLLCLVSFMTAQEEEVSLKDLVDKVRLIASESPDYFFSQEEEDVPASLIQSKLQDFASDLDFELQQLN